MRRLAGILGVVAVVSAAAVSQGRAEDVVTKTDGAKLRGKVIAENSTEVKIKTTAGVLTIPRDEVASVERGSDVYGELARRQAALEKKPSGSGWYDLARWCQTKELPVVAFDCLKKAVAVDPDNVDARTELGFRKLDGRWVTEAEYWTAQGYVPYEGRWVTKADKDQYDQGLVKWTDGEWITAAEAERRQQELDREAENHHRGIPTTPGAKPEAPEATAKAGKIAAEKPRYFEGKLLYTKSREQIVAALAAIEQEKIEPLAPAKHEFEPLDSAFQIAALRRLKGYRYLSDVPTDVDLNADYAELCQAGCKLLDLVGHLDHTPAQPPGCPDALYKAGYKGTSRSNLHQNGDTVHAVDGFIYDSDPSNIDRVGHRRWCLNQGMKQTAFGCWKQFVAMYSFDQGHAIAPYDAVLYPARGYYPTDHIRADAAWSAHLSTRFNQVTDKDVKVTVFPIDVNMKKGAPVEIDYLHVDSQGFGTGSSCVIFRPKASIVDGARYWVAIAGIKEGGQDSTLEYMVEFFKP